MYNTITTPDVAVCHLFLYCCFKDGQVKDEELDNVSAKFTLLGMQKTLNFKDEMVSFRGYRESITDEQAYLSHLLSCINPTNEAALLSYCAELMLSDDLLDAREEALLANLAGLLSVTGEQLGFISKLMIQRKVVETQQFF
ncbi:TerB family tellurite resistance protein [Foetidibacter luteolus]|uniref:TerB family tellurite resistance protein n=1 Tax=Foetidibacter luteolus TaxID=2608880 RepID=UPI00129A9112|nr:TerB family tellurite resistance protein [Foetidibacter luteolus]